MGCCEQGNNPSIYKYYYPCTASFYDSITKYKNRNDSRGCISLPSTKGCKTIHHLWDTCFGYVWMHLQDADAICSLSPTLSYYRSLITGNEITGCQLTVATQHPQKQMSRNPSVIGPTWILPVQQKRYQTRIILTFPTKWCHKTMYEPENSLKPY